MRRLFLAVALTSALSISGSRAAAGSLPSALLTVSAPSTQPSGAPVILRLSVFNTGFSSIGYWCGGPGEFPDARNFVASIRSIDPRGYTAEGVTLANGQRSGVGRMRWIVPGQVTGVPTVLPPLPVGAYEISVHCQAEGPTQDGLTRPAIWPEMRTVKPVRIEVGNDAVIAELRDHIMIAGVRAADPFLAFVANTFPRPAVTTALAEDLMAPNPITVERAMDGLWGEGVPDKPDVPLLAKAIQQHLRPSADEPDFAMMERLIQAIGTDRGTPAKEVVAKAAAARTGRVHEMAVSTLTKMRYPSSVARRPAPIPPDQYDRDAIIALIKLSRSMGAPERKLAYTLLAEYPKSPEAAATIREGTADPDPEVNATAHQALNRITP